MLFQCFFSLLCAALSNAYCLLVRLPWWAWPCWAALLTASNFLPLCAAHNLTARRLRVCRHGVICLRGFLWSLPVDILFHIALLCSGMSWKPVLFSALVCTGTEALIFWNGMLCVYCASAQLGLKRRAIGLLCGLVPISNLIQLVRILRVVQDEVDFEDAKNRLDAERHDARICATRYPLLLVHGVFFRDFKFPPYWGRIPAALERNGAQIFYGEHQSAASIEGSAAELCARIEAVCAQTGCEKVNVIAHSKGGLDIRAAAVICPERIASITTINTPHRGCGFADYLLEKIPQRVQNRIAKTYNAAAHCLGDHKPDFLSAVRDLTAERCRAFDASHPAPDGILCRSVGSVLEHPSGGKFPLNFTYRLAGYFDGPNDGLVAASSFRWGEDFTLLTPDGKRGISHGDVIDLNRENIPGFDVREFYVQLAADLKRRGL